MKRFVLTMILVALIAMNASAQIEIKGTYKYGSKNEKIHVKAIPSSSGDQVVKLEFAPLTRLEKEVKDLRSTEAKLRKELERCKVGKPSDDNTGKINALQDSISSLQRQIAAKDSQLDELNRDMDELRRAVAECRRQSADSVKVLLAEINKLKLSSVKQYCNHDALVVGGGINMSKLINEGIEADPWTVGLPIGKEFEASWLHYFSQTSPVALRVGVAYRELNGNARCDMIRDTLFNRVDADNDYYDARYLFNDITEKISLKQLSVPIMLHVGNSYRNFGLKGWIEAGVALSYGVSTNLERGGTYSCEGYYPQWNVTVNDVPAMGYVSSAQLKVPDENVLNNLTLWGQLAAGVYVPVSDNIGMELGGTCGYSLLSVSSGEGFDGRRYDENAMMIINGGKTKIFSTAIKLGVVFHL